VLKIIEENATKSRRRYEEAFWKDQQIEEVSV